MTFASDLMPVDPLAVLARSTVRIFAGVTQKYLIVTSNYPARQKGVAKLMSIKEAQQKCPDLVLINGEDLTPYRQAAMHKDAMRST